MKKFLLLLLLLINSIAFSQDFEKNWKKVVEYEKDGKVKSASEEVDKIYHLAKKKKNEPEIIKTFFYKSKYILALEEDSQSKIIVNIQNEIITASIPSKAILQLVYAECLNGYLDRNEYRLKDRGTIEKDTDEDFKLWDKKKFEQEIKKNYAESLKNESILKSTPLKNYKEILEFEKIEKVESKSLYDYVIQANIDYYVESSNIYFKNFSSNPLSEKFYDLYEFKNTSFESLKNETILNLVRLLQKLENDNPTDLNFALARLKHLDQFVFDQKLHLNLLNTLSKKSTDSDLLQEILLEKAKFYNQQAEKKHFPNNYKIAIKTLDTILSNINRSNTYKTALLLKNKILEKSLSINLLDYSYTNENTRAFVTYKNVDTLKAKFYKIPQNFQKSIEKEKNKDSIITAKIENLKEIKTLKRFLPRTNDHFTHTTEVLLPNLETGNYILVFESGISNSQEDLNYIFITSSDFLVSYKEDLYFDYYQILNRKTGFPIEDVKLNIDSQNGKTNKLGNVKFKKEIAKKNFYRHTFINLSKDKDSLSIPYHTYIRGASDNEEEISKSKAHIFTDRAIYRPGQTVYAKAILTQEENGISNVVANMTVHIKIEDPNYGSLKQFDLKTNEFGSITFEYKLPASGLAGNYKIEIEEADNIEKDPMYDKSKDEHPFWDNTNFENSYIYFSVEEYKRPTFEINFDSIIDHFAINDSIRVRGSVKAFSGSKISNSNVKFNIVRSVSLSDNSFNFIFDNHYTISSGEVKTDAEGKFEIPFKALAINELNKEKLPIYHYQISVDVTDINGETRNKSTTINAGYQTIKLSLKVPTTVDLHKKNTITINSQNLNNQLTPVKGNLKFYLISKSSQKIKRNPFGAPEISSIANTEFEKLFPFEDNASLIDIEDHEKMVFTKEVNTEKDKEIGTEFMSEWPRGVYKIRFEAKDNLDNVISESREFVLTDSKKDVILNQLFKCEQLNADPKKDGFVDIKLTSTIPQLFINAVANYNNNIVFEKPILLNNNEAILRIPVSKYFNNDVLIRFSSVFENNSFEERMTIELKKDETAIGIEVLTLRNKIEPGSNEIWSFKINQPDKKIEAEVLASMYDNSLDQFAIKDWTDLKTDLYYDFAKEFEYFGFERRYLNLKNLNTLPPYINFSNLKIGLNYFGFDFNNLGVLKHKYEQELKRSKIPANAKLVYGIITERGIPLAGATILVNGTDRNTQADFDGYFEINALKGEELVVMYIGLKSKIVKVDSQEVNINLEFDDEEFLESVIVTGYISTKKLRSIAAVTYSETQKKVNQDISIFLQGRVAGVNISGSGQPGSETQIILRGNGSIDDKNAPLFIVDGLAVPEDGFSSLNQEDIESIIILKDASATSIYGNRGINGVFVITTKKAIEELSKVQTRKNFNETAFFFPQIKTDKDGKISFNFTSPEVLTQWKLRIFAHNKKAVSGYLESLVVTQKDLMVMPNLPRFLREKDSITITSKISNLTSEAKSGMALLQLFDAVSTEPIDAKMLNSNNTKSFQVNAKGNTSVSWKIYVPEGLQGVQYKIVAKAGNFSDGEENILPVLTNSMLVTESIPVWVRENSMKEYTFENLKNNTSSTLRNQQLTLEYTSNPTWLAIQSLPYLMEYEHECAEQTFARYYANALASEILNSNPKIAEVFESWKKSERPISKLQQNEELKSILLAETPWVTEGQSEEEKKKMLATLFDLQKMKDSQKTILEKLTQKQKSSGGFAWFDGGEENEYVTRHIISGLGHLQKLSKNATGDFDKITQKGISYLDQKFTENHKRTEALNKSQKLLWNYPYDNLHYLYARSFYLEKYPLSESTLLITKKYTENIKENWLQYSLYEKGLASLVLSRFGEKETAKKILENLRQTSSNNEDWGMYWKENKAGWYWYQAPIETQALLIEAFAEIENDKKSVDAMKVWLVKNKQNKNWPTTKATTEAVYALLMQGTDWISVKDKTIIKLGDEKIITEKLAENEKEAGTGYIKMTWKTDEISKEMATVSINNKSDVPGFGGFYWQYLEDLDKIKTSQASVMNVEKELYLKATTSNGDQLQRITSTKPLKIGDLVTVRLVITAKEDMEFVHLKDMRASCFEPIDVLSGNNYKDGLRFYKSTKDVATHFFFDQIKKGTYVLEYDIRVNNLGDFSNGITTIQSMYAPEFSSHTKGIRVKISE